MANKNLTVAESRSIESPVGNALAIYVNPQGELMLKDIKGNQCPVSEYLPIEPAILSISGTKSEIDLLKAESLFIVGATYIITDADVNLYGGTSIALTAVSNSELSLSGTGIFYCPKYDLSTPGYGIWTTYMEGTFSNIVGTFTSGETVTAQNGATAIYLAEGFLNYVSGDWSTATSISGTTATANVVGFVSPFYEVGTIVHWGGKSWRNKNQNIGTSLDKYKLDEEWEEIPFNATDYNVYIDEIQYDFGNDMIIYRKDRYNNVVSGCHQVFVEFESPDGYGYGNPIKDFQWGCAQDDFNTDDYFYIGIQGNKVIDSYFETLNSLTRYIWFNELSQQSYIYNNTLSSCVISYNTLSDNSYIENNTLSDNSYIESNTLSSSTIGNNTLSNSSTIGNNTLSSSGIQINNLSNGSMLQFTGGDVVSKTLTRLTMKGNNTSIPITATIIFNQNISKTIFQREDGTSRLQYVNNSDVIVITDVNA